MKIGFYLRGDKAPGGAIRIREHFEMIGGGVRTDVNGRLVPAIDIQGHVDDDIRIQHPKEYAAFAALVEKHQDAAYAVVRANPGKRVYASDFVPEVEAPAVEVKVLDSEPASPEAEVA